MTSFSERLAAAKAAPRPFRDVEITLDDGVSAEREALRDELKAAKAADANDQRLAAIPTADAVQERLDALDERHIGSLITLRFTRLPGDQWAEIVARCPARPDVLIDRNYGYNMNAVCKFAAPLSGVRVEGEELVPLVVAKATPDAPAVDEWSDLFATISGHELGLIIDTIYELNEYAPAERVSILKKELATRPA